jgi:hypothetical protein
MTVIPFKKPKISPEKAQQLRELQKQRRQAEKVAAPVPRARYSWPRGKKHYAINMWLMKIAADDNLPTIAYRVAMLMVDRFNSVDGRCWVSVNTFSKGDGLEGKMDPRRIKEGRKALWKRGYLDRVWAVPEQGYPETMIYYPSFPIPSAKCT